MENWVDKVKRDMQEKAGLTSKELVSYSENHNVDVEFVFLTYAQSILDKSKSWRVKSADN